MGDGKKNTYTFENSFTNEIDSIGLPERLKGMLSRLLPSTYDQYFC